MIKQTQLSKPCTIDISQYEDINSLIQTNS